MKTRENTLGTLRTAVQLFHYGLGYEAPELDLALVSREFDFTRQYDCPEEFRANYWFAESCSKIPLELEGLDRAGSAFERFREAEAACAVANSRLCDGLNRPDLPFTLLSRARAIVKNVLGSFEWPEAFRYCDFGPGATTSLPRSRALPANKWQASHITSAALPLLLAFRKFNPGLHETDLRIEIVAGNKVTTVPKNAKTDRVIAIEPDWNMFFQKGVGGLIRYRLNKRLGLLRNTAADDHREMAMWGSVTGNIATIDLRNASDSVSLALCELLLPDDWLSAILLTRSPVGTVNGDTIVYEKVSSMGNGYTFELETLLFYALTRAVCTEGTVSVFGDDIICPTEYAAGVIDLLHTCGFEVNTKKTHIAGRFRESCGGHYFNGYDVTPPYFRTLLTDEIHFISLANRISAAATQRYGFSRDARFRSVHRFLASKARFFGPYSAGDGVVHCSFDEGARSGSATWSRRLYCHRVRCLLPKTRRNGRTSQIGGVLASLWGGERRDMPTVESFRQERVDWRYGVMYCQQWDGPGPWV